MYCIANMRMAKDTHPVQTKTGTRMENGFGFIDIDGRQGLPASVVAFGKLADELAKYEKGAVIRISGIFKANDYTNREGDVVSGYQIIAEGIAGIKSSGIKHQEEENSKQLEL